MAIRDIKWIQFELKNENKAEAFEKMCTHLFCRIYQISGRDIKQDFNQPGLEIFPVPIGEEVIGFQCKYCETSTKFYQESYNSVCKALELYPNLTKIILFTQLKLGNSLRANSAQRRIENLCKKRNCKVDFFCNMQFDLELSKCIDIYDFYFSNERISRMFLDLISLDERNFLLSSNYLDLKLTSNGEVKTMSVLINRFMESGIYLIEGKAGTGKTEILKKIFLKYEENYFECIGIKTSPKQKNDENSLCIKPIFIRLREISTNDLSSRINAIKMQYKITDDDCKFVYFFDGVDEINSTDFIASISVINALEKNKNTHAIFFSTRLDSTNYFVLLNEFKNVIKYSINMLNNLDKYDYINKHVSSEYSSQLIDIVDENEQMFNDIFSLSILCTNSKNVSNDLTVVELIEFDIKSIERINYNKIVSLNLPNPKFNCLQQIVKAICFEMAKESKLQISIKNIQDIVKAIYPNIDYTSMNKIVEVILMMFFDVKENYVTLDTYAMFKHKRYYEYFLYCYLKDNMYENPFLLRELEIFSQRELFISFLLTQEIKEAHKNEDLYKISFLGFIVSKLSKDYCSIYFNKWLNEKIVDPYNEITYYDKIFVDYLCLLNEEEIKNIIDNDELIFGAFINSHNNSMLLFSYLLKNNVDLSWIYTSCPIDFENNNEAYVYYYLYEYLVGKRSFTEIKEYFFNSLDSLPIISKEQYIANIKNNANYNLRIMMRYFVEYNMPKLIEILIDEEMNPERFDKFCYILLDDNISWIFSKIDDGINEPFINILNDKIKKFSDDCKYYCIFAVDYLINKEKKNSTNIESYIEKNNVNHLMTWKSNETVLTILANSLKSDIRFFHSDYHIVASVKEILFSYKKVEEKQCIRLLLDTLNGYSFEWSNFFTYDISIFISNMMGKLNFESTNIRYFIENVSKAKINKFAFVYNIFLVNKNIFIQAFDSDIIKSFYEESKNALCEYDTLSQQQIQYANMLSVYDKNLFYRNILKSINYNIFRPNFSKENLIAIREPMALYCMIEKGLLNKQEQEDFLKRNLLQLDVTKETLYRSFYPDMLKYLYNYIKPLFDYHFNYDVTPEIPLVLNSDFTLKKFDKEFLTAYDYKAYNVHSYDFWCDCIKYLIDNKSEDWIYELLDKNYYPSFWATSISNSAYLIIAALIKNNLANRKFFEYITIHMSSEGYFQLLLAFLYSNNYDIAKRLFQTIYNLVDVMVYYDRKHCESFDYEIMLNKQIMNIIYNSETSDYISTDFDEVLLYQKNPDIYIKKPGYSDEGEFEWKDYNQEWAKFYDNTAKLLSYHIYYKNHIIDEISILSVDGGKGYIPLLNSTTGEYKENEYRFVLLICEKNIVDHYIWHAQYNINKKNDN